MFFKIGVSQKLRNRKTPVLESVFDKVAGLKFCTFMKKRLVIVVKFLKIAFFYRTPPEAAFVSLIQ